MKVLPNVSVAGVLGDREFIGKRWFGWLTKQGLPFYFRVKKDARTTNAQGKSVAIHQLFRDVALHQARLIKGRRSVYGHDVFIVGTRIEKDYLIIVTNQAPTNADDVLKIYGIRWSIETLFGCLKSKGFYFEDTHITRRCRIKKMMAVLTIAFCWAHLTGEWRHEHEKAIITKKHGRPQYSFFRYGLDWISEKLVKRGRQLRQLTRVCRKLLLNTTRHVPIEGKGLC